MAAPGTPFPIQKSDVDYGAETIYRLLDDLFSEGVIDGLAVSQKSAGANMSVDVAAGSAVLSMDTPYGGKRRARLAGVSNSGTPGAPNTSDGWVTTFSTADATNPRVDRVVLVIRDSNVDAGGAYDAVFKVVAGTPTAGATLSNLNGAAAVPVNSLLIANVLVGAAATDIDNADIGDARVWAAVGGGAAVGALAASVTKAALQSIPNNAWTAITFDTLRRDDGGLWSSGSGSRLTAPANGWYVITGVISWGAPTASSFLGARIRKNGSTAIARQEDRNTATGGAGAIQTTNVSKVAYLSAGDYVELEAFQDTGVALNVSKNADDSPEFSMARL